MSDAPIEVTEIDSADTGTATDVAESVESVETPVIEDAPVADEAPVEAPVEDVPADA